MHKGTVAASKGSLCRYPVVIATLPKKRKAETSGSDKSATPKKYVEYSSPNERLSGTSTDCPRYEMALGLLNLPREIRDQILDYVVSWPMMDPPCLLDHEALRNARSELMEPRLRAWTRGCWVRYLQPKCIVHGSPLLCVNSQLHKETLDALYRYVNKHVYLIDVVILNEVEVIPTWLHVPQLTNRVDRFHATVRISGTYRPEMYADIEESHQYKGFGTMQRAAPAMHWVLFSVLERFLLVGPVPRWHAQRDREVSIKTFIIDICTPPSISPGRFGSPQSVDTFSESFNPNHVLSPTYLYEFIKSNVRWLLDMSHHSSEFGAILYEHIGRIVMAFDGVEKHSFDLAEELNGLRYDGSLSGSEEDFDKWKCEAKNKRCKYGLPI